MQRKQADQQIKLDLMRIEHERMEKQKAEQRAALEKRRNQAALLSGFVGFPIPYCMRALEEHPDNLDRAADWALLNFEQYQLYHPELFIESSPSYLSQFPPQNDSDTQSHSEKMELTDTSFALDSESKPTPETTNKNINNTNVTNVPMEVESKNSIYSQEEQRQYYMSDSYTMNLLEYDNKFYCRIHAQHRPLEFTIEQVHIGSYFRVGEITESYRDSFPLWLKTMDRTISKVGVVKDIDHWRLMVRMKFYDDDNLTTAMYWYPVSTLDAIQNHKQPIVSFNGHLEEIPTLKQLTDLLVESEEDVAVLFRRTAIFMLLHHWPQNFRFIPLRMSHNVKEEGSEVSLNSPQSLVNDIIELLLLHCSKEIIPSLTTWSTLSSPSADVFESFSSQLISLSSLMTHRHPFHEESLSRLLMKLCQREPLLVNKLIEVTFDLFTEAAQFTETNLHLYESEHPYHIQKLTVNDLNDSNFSYYYGWHSQQQQQEKEMEFSNAKLVHRISVRNANALFIYFDYKSNLNDNDTLCFYADEQLCHLVKKYTPKNLPNNDRAFPFCPLLVKEPYLWVTLEREIGRRPPILQKKATNWGWKFIVVPTHISLNLAVWLFSFLADPTHKELLSTAGSYLTILLRFFVFLLNYLTENSMPPHIQQVILELLVHILHASDTKEGDVAAFLLAQDKVQSHLKNLELNLHRKLKDFYSTASFSDMPVLCSSHLQSLFQFLALARKKQQDLLFEQKSTLNDNKENEVSTGAADENLPFVVANEIITKIVEALMLIDFVTGKKDGHSLPTKFLRDIWLETKSNFNIAPNEISKKRPLLQDNGELTAEFERVVEETFQRFDDDKDGLLNEAEFKNFLSVTAIPGSALNEMQNGKQMSILNFKKILANEYLCNPLHTWQRLFKLGYYNCLHIHAGQFGTFEEVVLSQNKWTLSMDEKLVQYLDHMNDLDKNWKEHICYRISELFPSLQNDKMTFELVIMRVGILQHLSDCVEASLPFIDMSTATQMHTIAHQITSIRNILLARNKFNYFDKVLLKTAVRNSNQLPLSLSLHDIPDTNAPTIYVDRLDALKFTEKYSNLQNVTPKATHLLDSGDFIDEKEQITFDFTSFESDTLNFLECYNNCTVFLQAMAQLDNELPSLLRQPDRSFKVIFKRESAEGEVGPYRESITQISSELQSRKLPLFIPCSNARLAAENIGVGEAGRDKWIPNPSAKSPFCLKMFEFVGKLLGIAIRSKNPLPLDLPLLFWKSLVGSKLDATDLREVDYLEYETIEKMKEMDKQTFETSLFETFTCILSDGSRVPLIPNGQQVPVTFENKDLFANLKLHCRLNESAAQIDAIKRGLFATVPQYLLKILSVTDLQLRACGSPDIDLGLLKKHTRYRGGIKETDPHIKFFWNVLEKMSQQERRLFLRFAWGRDRLPSEKDFKEDMKIFPNLRPNPDSQLPHAETCFFNVSLPKYSSEKIMREKLLIAITNTHSMDGETILDNNAAHDI